jgi:hypothetical protein
MFVTFISTFFWSLGLYCGGKYSVLVLLEFGVVAAVA